MYCCTIASLVAQLVKNLPAMQETWVRSLGWENPLEKGKATVFWPGEFHGLYRGTMGSQRVGQDWVTFTFTVAQDSSVRRVCTWFNALLLAEYCIGTWNVRSMNQGKLEVIKQEMARMKVYILGISELKWTGMDEFNWDNHYIYYCGQESLRRNEVAIIVNKGVPNAVLGCKLKNDRMISVRFQGKHSISW